MHHGVLTSIPGVEMACEATGAPGDKNDVRMERPYVGRGRSAAVPLARQALDKPPLRT